MDLSTVGTTADTSIVVSSIADVADIFSSAVTMVTGNPISLFFIGVAVIGAGIGLFRRVIKH